LEQASTPPLVQSYITFFHMRAALLVLAVLLTSLLSRRLVQTLSPSSPPFPPFPFIAFVTRSSPWTRPVWEETREGRREERVGGRGRRKTRGQHACTGGPSTSGRASSSLDHAHAAKKREICPPSFPSLPSLPPVCYTKMTLPTKHLV
jgi:hypothetical protein